MLLGGGGEDEELPEEVAAAAEDEEVGLTIDREGEDGVPIVMNVVMSQDGQIVLVT
jgi:hypothetical protein